MSKGVKGLFDKLGKKKTLLVACAAAVVIIAAVALYFAFAGQSARDFYFKAESKNYKKFTEDIKRLYEEFRTGRESYLKDRYKKRSEITLDISSESDNFFGIQNADSIMDVIKKSKLILDTRYDPSGDKSLAKISLLFDKSPIIDAEAFTKGRELGFTVPVLIPDKYFLVNLDRLNEVYERFKIPVRPKNLLKQDDLVQRIYFDEKELERIRKEYGKLISGFIDKENVTYGEDRTVMVGGQERTGRQVFVSLDKEAAEKLFSAVLNKAADDDPLLRLVFGNLSSVSENLDNMGLYGILNLMGDSLSLNEHIKAIFKALNVKGDIEEFKSRLKEFAAKTEFPEGVKMELVIDKQGNILARDVSLEWAGADEESNTVSFRVGTRFDPYAKDGDVKGRVEFAYGISREEVKVFSIETGFDIERFTELAALKKNTRIKYDIKIRDDRADVSDSFHGELNIASAKNNKQKTVNVSTGLTVNMELPSMDIKDTSLKLNIVTENKLGIEEFSIPDRGGADDVRLDDITDEGLAALQEEILASFGTFYLNNKQLVDALIP